MFGRQWQPRDVTFAGTATTALNVWEQPADWLEDLAAITEMLQVRSCPWRCPDKDRPQ